MVDLADVTPTVDDVAALITSRTFDEYGNELGEFTAETRPTDSQVSTLCAVAAADALIALGVDVAELPVEFADEVRQLAAVRCAALIQWSFFPEQATAATSAGQQFTAVYLAGVEELTERLRWSPLRLS